MSSDPQPMRIFVAGPYSNVHADKRAENVVVVNRVVKELILRGHIVLECHNLEHVFYQDAALHHSHFLQLTTSWLKFCDAIYVVAESPGVNIEIEHAATLGLKIYRDLEQIRTVTVDRSQISQILTEERSKFADQPDKDD